MTSFHTGGFAEMSPCGRYRYWLTRHWGAEPNRVIWIMLNPSTADATVDDATVRKCVGFSRHWGRQGFDFGNLLIANLFALRSTNPHVLLTESDPFGPLNLEWLRFVLTGIRRDDLLVAAWGTHGTLFNAGQSFLSLAREYKRQPMCLGYTVNGQPRHPARLSYDTPLQLMET